MERLETVKTKCRGKQHRRGKQTHQKRRGENNDTSCGYRKRNSGVAVRSFKNPQRSTHHPHSHICMFRRSPESRTKGAMAAHPCDEQSQCCQQPMERHRATTSETVGTLLLVIRRMATLAFSNLDAPLPLLRPFAPGNGQLVGQVILEVEELMDEVRGRCR